MVCLYRQGCRQGTYLFKLENIQTRCWHNPTGKIDKRHYSRLITRWATMPTCADFLNCSWPLSTVPSPSLGQNSEACRPIMGRFSESAQYNHRRHRAVTQLLAPSIDVEVNVLTLATHCNWQLLFSNALDHKLCHSYMGQGAVSQMRFSQ